nr:hypothetical protein [uncultured Psychrobacter sp.]
MNIYVFLGVWLLLWIISWWVAKNKYKAKQPVGVGFLASMFILVFVFYAVEFLLREDQPTAKELNRTEELIQEAKFLEENSAKKVKICIAYDSVMNNATDNLNQELFQEYKNKYEEKGCDYY